MTFDAPQDREDIARTERNLDRLAGRVDLMTAVQKPAILAPVPQNVDEIVVTARKARTLGGVRINLNLPYPLEQLWVVTSDGQIVYVPTIAVMSTDSCGNTLGANRPAGAVPNDVSALIHTHSDWGNARPGAGDYTSAQRFDVYNINRGGTWVLRQGAARGSAPTTLSGRAPGVPSSGGGATCR